ncbi:MAG: deoxyribodipyrimidine photo-lyase [Anaerolineales bacterium]|nr:deoxyribodipyrimidine photo-lyase [Anaerolineales bacterium]MCB9127687.1 deoxyribodipyrimidine photo-lyase [Ardenticatenales bacterium]
MPIIWWMRRDLRLNDNRALQAALDSGVPVVPLFIADPTIIAVPNMGAARLHFCYASVRALDERLRAANAGYVVTRRGPAVDVLRDVAAQLGAVRIVANRDYTPLAQRRDGAVQQRLAEAGIRLDFYEDGTLFAPDEILTKSNQTPYQVYGPYARRWFQATPPAPVGAAWPALPPLNTPPDLPTDPLPALAELGFEPPQRLAQQPGEAAAHARLDEWFDLRRNDSVRQYATQRNLPAVAGGTSELSAHLRFGTISPRTLFQAAQDALSRSNSDECTESIQTWLSELAWRDFYAQLLFHQPRLLREPYDRDFADLPWSGEADLFEAWRSGTTGYPIVDAGMRQLNQSHWMHNRVRMITASFLVKDLLIAWQRGYDYFMATLVDGDPASNNGGWQWAASTGGPSAQPWFRIFNPLSQSKKSDPTGDYIRRWIPALRDVPTRFIHTPWQMSERQQAKAHCRIGTDYPAPIVDHEEQRERTLQLYRRAKSG